MLADLACVYKPNLQDRAVCALVAAIAVLPQLTLTYATSLMGYPVSYFLTSLKLSTKKECITTDTNPISLRFHFIRVETND